MAGSGRLLIDLAHKYIEFLESGLRGGDIETEMCRFAGIDPTSVVKGRADGYVPQFDAPDDVDSEGHIIFQPFAGNAVYRTLPDELITQITEVLRAQPYPVFLITRSYTRRGVKGTLIHTVEDARRFESGNIQVHEHLSVPACLNLIKKCRAYVGSWSSLQQAAWFENKPVAVFYPHDYTDVKNRTDYAFGLDRPDCLHCEYPDFSKDKLSAWLSKW